MLLSAVVLLWFCLGYAAGRARGASTNDEANWQGGHKASTLWEIEPAYVDVTVTRWEDFTGRKAKRMTR